MPSVTRVWPAEWRAGIDDSEKPDGAGGPNSGSWKRNTDLRFIRDFSWNFRFLEIGNYFLIFALPTSPNKMAALKYCIQPNRPLQLVFWGNWVWRGYKRLWIGPENILCLALTIISHNKINAHTDSFCIQAINLPAKAFLPCTTIWESVAGCSGRELGLLVSQDSLSHDQALADRT